MARRSQNRKLSSASVYLCLTFGLIAVIICGFICAPHAVSRTRSGRRITAHSSLSPQPTPTPATTRLGTMGQPPPVPVLSKKNEEINAGDVISVNTSEVMLPVTVRDSSGRLVADLTRENFRVFEDGREQPLTDLALRHVPVDVILMVDASSSVAANLDDFRRAAEQFASQLDLNDRICLIKFDDRVQLLQDWTRSRFQLGRALSRIEPGIFTRFNDALVLAAREQFQPSSSRRAIIILSDGIDSGRGTASAASVLQALLEAQATVYVVSNTEISRASKRAELDSLTGGSDSMVKFNQIRIDDLREGLRVLDESEQGLAQMAAATGGRLYKPLSFNKLDEAYREVADELHRQYAIYYTPLNKARDGTFRRVRVETTRSDFKTSTRIGYYAPHR